MKRKNFINIKEKFHKLTNRAKGRVPVNSSNINKVFDFDDLEACRTFLCNLYIGNSRVNEITLANDQRVKMEDIPEDQIIQRARELRGWIYGKPELNKGDGQ